ncbi:hypothetical protein [uncultured Georgenia sp.]|uniref:hypothetical protein n=1 Tax=uncultured Georgenia sp. TaxID=378209 RepID=UPI00261E933B|nr:hypothetical protein [uncultured Georgenia sp.]HLV05139.1 hypothetical protein [Actinomycetaceae bacterium]
MAGPTRGAAEGGNVPDDDLDAKWAELTARLGELRLPPDDDEEDDAAATSAAQPPPASFTPAPGPRDYSPAPETDDEDDDPARDLVDGFVAPDPDPLARAEPVVVLGWVSALGGIALMVVCVLLWRGAPGLVWLAAAGALAIGLGLLLWRMPARRDVDDHDDGAVV